MQSPEKPSSEKENIALLVSNYKIAVSSMFYAKNELMGNDIFHKIQFSIHRGLGKTFLTHQTADQFCHSRTVIILKGKGESSKYNFIQINVSKFLHIEECPVK